MSTLNHIHQTVVVGLGNLLYNLGLYTPYYTNMLYYPYRRPEFYKKEECAALSDEEWLNSDLNHELGHTCKHITKHPNGTYTCLDCTCKYNIMFKWYDNRKIGSNRWTIPKITLSNDEHDTKAVYYVLPWQMYLICEGTVVEMFEMRFFYNSAPDMDVLKRGT